MAVITTNLMNKFWKKGVKPVYDDVKKKLNISKVINNLLTTEEGYALDARQGKVLQDQLDELNTGLTAFRCYTLNSTAITWKSDLIDFFNTLPNVCFCIQIRAGLWLRADGYKIDDFGALLVYQYNNAGITFFENSLSGGKWSGWKSVNH